MLDRVLHPSWRYARVTGPAAVLAIPVLVGVGLTASYLAFALPPVPVPSENPLTPEKIALGKILFWDEQLSTSNVMACATCHIPRRAGGDPRLARNPGPDAIMNTPDDIFGSLGVIRSDGQNNYRRDPVFGTRAQITGRAANSPINAAYAPELFWDGRATSEFRDPQTGAVIIASGGALESQAVGPILSDVEMAHERFDWMGVAVKLASVRPLDLAASPPADVQAALAGNPSYAELFRRAFGDEGITAARIGKAIASYQRTLISDQTPYDRHLAGVPDALTPAQAAGLDVFAAAGCMQCHTAPLLTDSSFRNTGVRPAAEDRGREQVTGNPADAGKFKVPGLRNIGLRRTFMHNGQFLNLTDVLRWYARTPTAPPRFTDNLDPAMQNVNLVEADIPLVEEFLRNGLADARVSAETAPFDRPQLFTERGALQAVTVGGGNPGSGGQTPRPILAAPALVGLESFRIGLENSLGGATARLALSLNPPVNGRVTPDRLLGPVVTSGVGPGAGVATIRYALFPWRVADGQSLYAQWIIADPAAVGGEARSLVARFPVFCGLAGCPCPGDLTRDGAVDFNDLLQFLNEYNAQTERADIDGDGTVDFNDFLAYLNLYNAGC
jgi:cytochrome c peroxidase